jgi:hypothetical protein
MDSRNRFVFAVLQPSRIEVLVVERDRCVEIAWHGQTLGRHGCQVVKLGLRTPGDPTAHDPAPCQRACRGRRVQSEWRPPVQNSGCRVPRPE